MKLYHSTGSLIVIIAILLCSVFALTSCGQTEKTAAEADVKEPAQEAPVEEPVPEEPAEELSVAGEWTMSFSGLFGEEMFTLTLNEDGTCTLASSNSFVGPWSGAYEHDGELVNVLGLDNPDGAFGTKPDLWPEWFDADGNCEITLDPAAGTFIITEIEDAASGAAASGEADKSASGEASYTDGEYVVWENAGYGDLSSQTFNAKYKEQPGARPVLVAVPGGAFRFVDAGKMNYVYDYFVEHGYLVVQINYTVGEGTYLQAIIDVKSAIQYIVDNADVMHADVDSIHVLGCSAGGYLAAMAVFTGPDDFKADAAPSYTYTVSSFIDFFGATQWMTDSFMVGEGSPEASWVGSDIAAMAETLDPVAYLSADTAPSKIWISHGTADSTIDIGMSEQLYAACVDVLGEDAVHFEPIEGANHEGAEFYSAENFALVDAFISGASK